MPQISTLQELMIARAEQTRTGISFVEGLSKAHFLSYPDLHQHAESLLAYLRENGVKQHDKVVLVLQDNEQILTCFWACILGGMIPVPVAAGSADEHKEKLRHIFKDLENPYLITNEQHFKRLEKYYGEHEHKQFAAHLTSARIVLPASLPVQEDVTDQNIARVSAEDIAYIQYSSGSTSVPKGIVLTHENLVNNIRDIASRSQMTASDRSLSWMPLHHDMGMICFHLTSLFGGIDQHLIPTEIFIRRPMLWLDAAEKAGASLIYSPNFGLKYLLTALDGRSEKQYDLSAIRLLYNGAEPISHEICQQFQTTLAAHGLRPDIVFPGYGLAEASVAVTLPTPGRKLITHYLKRDQLNVGQRVEKITEGEGSTSFVSVGHAMDTCAVRICGDDDKPLPDEYVGHIQIKGANVTSGYFNKEAINQGLYTPNGWLRTGDLGLMMDGDLVVTGRQKQMIIINGQNYYPHDLEKILTRIDGIEIGKVVVCGDISSAVEQLAVFVIYRKKLEHFKAVISNINARLKDTIGLQPRFVIPIRQIPKTTSGKVQYFVLQQNLKNGHYDKEISQLYSDQLNTDHAHLHQKIRSLVSPFLPYEIDSDATYLTGLNSIDIIQITSVLNKAFKTDINPMDLISNSSIQSIAARIAEAGERNISQEAEIFEDQLHYPLLKSQERLYYLHDLKRDSSLNVAVNYHFKGTLDIELLQTAFQQLLAQYDVLRTVFVTLDGVPRQVVQDVTKVEGGFSDHGAINQLQLQAMLVEVANSTFDLAHPPLIRLGVYHTDEGYVLSLVMHHLISDGWSTELILEKLFLNYQSGGQGERPTHQLKDLVCQRLGSPNADSYERQQEYWQTRFAEEIKSVQLPGKHGDLSHSRAVTIAQTLDQQDYEKLTAFVKNQSVSLFTVIQAAVNLALYKYTKQPDLVIATEFINRSQDWHFGQIGYLINTLLIGTPVTEEATLSDYLKKTGDQVLLAMQNGHFEIDQLIAQMGIDVSNQAYSPLNTLLILQDYHGFDSWKSIETLQTVQRTLPPLQHSLVDLQMEFVHNPGAIEVNFRFNPDAYEEALIRLVLNDALLAMVQLIDKPALPVAELWRVTPKEQEQIVNVFNAPVMPVAADQWIISQWRQSAQQHADRIAIVANDVRLSYALADELTDKMAQNLISKHGIGPNSRVGIHLRRSENLILSLLSILKCGAAFIPIDIGYPAERKRLMIEDAAIDLLLVDGEEGKLSGCPNASISELTDTVADTTILPQQVDADALVYMMYTSGTTGKPKGVMIGYDALFDYVETFQDYFQINEHDKVIQQASLAFDTAIEEIFPVLLSGGQLIVMENGGADIEALLETIHRDQATVLSTTPLVIHEINQSTEKQSSLRLLISGGDRIRKGDVDQLPEYIELFNTYGPTESTVCATYQKITSHEDLHKIGSPIRNRRVYILNGELTLCGCYQPGQIAIAGNGLAWGYLNNEAATAQQFIDWELDGKRERLYLTGDQGYWNSKGEIIFIGRDDDQIKINGYRVEIAEVAQALIAHPAVEDAVCRVISETDGSGSQLWAYCIPTQQVETGELTSFVSSRLPAYMVPAKIMMVPEWPRTSTGKIDYKALPAEAVQDVNQPDRALTSTEQSVLTLWHEVFGSDLIEGIHSDFFALGGNSISGTRLVSKINQHFSQRFNLDYVFTHRTIEAQSKVIDSASVASTPSQPNVTTPLWLTSAQQRIWFAHQLETSSFAYNLNWTWRFEEALDFERLEWSVNRLIAGNETLRSYIETGTEASQLQIADDLNIALRIQEVKTDDSLEKRLKEDYQRPFDLSKPPLFRVSVLKLGEQYHVSFTFHHLIVDGWSLNIFLDQLTALYTHGDAEEVADRVRFSYVDYLRSKYQEETLAISAHHEAWIERFKDSPGQIDLQLDYPRSRVQEFNSEKVLLDLTSDVSKQLKSFSERHGVSTFALLLASIKILLFRYTGQQDLTLGTVASGRTQHDVSDLLGLFINLLPIRSTVHGQMGLLEFVLTIENGLREAFKHEMVPFDQLVNKLGGNRQSQTNPLFNVMVIGHHSTAPNSLQPDFDGIAATYVETKGTKTQYDLTFNLYLNEDDVAVGIEYEKGLFRPERIAHMSRHLEKLVTQLIASPEQKVSDVALLSYGEKQFIKTHTSGTKKKLPPAAIVLDLFDQQVEDSPEKVALHYGHQTTTYQQLSDRSLMLAKKILDLTNGHHQYVGVLLGRSDWLVVSYLAIMRSGSAFVPIDPAFPSERIELMLEDAGCEVLISETEWITQFEIDGVKTINIDEINTGGSIANEITLPAVDAEEIAYMIFTSGSTGRPKGVKVTHRNLLNFYFGMDEKMGLSAADHLLAVTSISFDISIFELLWTVCKGMSVTIKGDSEKSSEFNRYDAGYQRPQMDLGLFFFSSKSEEEDKYDLLIRSTKFVDGHQFKSVWTPERHFHSFGGNFPNPAVTSAALASVTRHVDIRSGSVVLPLHDEVRVAENWSLVDNISGGRVGMSFTAGWHPDDFVLAPDNFKERKQKLAAQIRNIQTLWSGESIRRKNGLGKEIDIRIFPRPVQDELPIWITAGGARQTFIDAGKMNANILTHFLGQSAEELKANIESYRTSLKENGHDPEKRTVTIMLHTYLGKDLHTVKEEVRAPFKAYLRDNVGLLSNVAKSMNIELGSLKESDVLDELLEVGFERYWKDASLIGTRESCAELVQKLHAIGVTEIACLIDFGLPTDKVMSSLELVADLKQDFTVTEPSTSKEPVTVLQTTPSLLKMLVEDEGSHQFLKGLKTIMIGGEKVPGDLIEQLDRLTQARLINVYGPTETTIWSTAGEMSPGKIDVGNPIVNTDIVIADQQLNIQPIGVSGEVLIGGEGVSKGYLNRPEEAKKKFIKIPELGYFYKTGDRGFLNFDGQLEITGRIDAQLKYLGYRLEPEEIEYHLLKFEGVKDAAVQIIKDGNERLVAFCVATESRPEESDIRAFLGAKLPAYLIPNHFVFLEALPLTPNGKKDRKALSTYRLALAEATQETQAGSPTEDRLHALLSGLLKKSDISYTANLFEVGFHSLLAIQLISMITKEFGIKVRMIDLFDNLTIRDIARIVDASDAEKYSRIPAIAEAAVYDVSHAQKRLWILDQIEEDLIAYNEPRAFVIEGELNAAVVEAAFTDLLGRHESLRTYFVNVDGEPKQKVFPLASTPFKLHYTDYSDQDNSLDLARRDADLEASAKFDLTEGPLIRARLIKTGPSTHVFLMTNHHIISDGWSMEILIKELLLLYTSRKNNESLKLPELKIQYKDYTYFQNQRLATNEFAAHEQYWLSEFEGEIPVINLPVDSPRPTLKTYTGDSVKFILPAALDRRVREFAQAHEMSAFMSYLGFVFILLHKYSRQQNIIVGSPVAGRDHHDLHDQIGFYVNALAIRNSIDPEATVSEFYEGIKQKVIGSLEHQLYPFDGLLEQINIERDLSRSPLFDVFLSYQNFDQNRQQHLSAAGLSVETFERDFVMSKYDLSFYVEELEDSHSITIEYNTDLFRQESVKRLQESLCLIMEDVCAHQEKKLSEVDFIPEQVRDTILEQYRLQPTPYAKNSTVDQLFAEQAVHSETARAILFDDQVLNYGEVANQVNGLAHFLYSNCSPQPGETIGILLDRSEWTVISMLAIWKTGASLVPIDPKYPQERIRFIIEDTRLQTIITTTAHCQVLEDVLWECEHFANICCLDDFEASDEAFLEHERNLRLLWDTTFSSGQNDTEANGWINSYTLKPFENKEIDELVGNVVQKVAPMIQKDMNVLEIGAGTGLIASQLHGLADTYYATDISEESLRLFRQKLEGKPSNNVVIEHLTAHQIDRLAGKEFGVIIINSVVQYFPSYQYLRECVEKAMALLAPNGTLFIGDVRDKELQMDYYQSLHPDASEADKIKLAKESETELFIDRSFFGKLNDDLPFDSTIEFSRKISTISNELSKYRYDVRWTVNKNTEVPTQKSVDKGVLSGVMRKMSAPTEFVSRSVSANLAYILYTSGSTGKPKGVKINHHSLVNFLQSMQKEPGIKAGDLLLSITNYTFDISMLEFFLPLVSGAQVRLLNNEDSKDPYKIRKYIAEERPAILQGTPTVLNEVFEESWAGEPSLKVLSGGEYLYPELGVRLLQKSGSLWNMYGPTETTIWSLVQEIKTESDLPSIGHPVANTSVYILDELLEVVPVGVEGELLIGGAGVAAGYHNRPDLSSEKFVKVAGLADEVLYRTGDLVKWMHDGRIKFIGRVDRQIKWNGHRLETVGIESAVQDFEGITNAIVILQRAHNHLFCYYQSDEAVPDTELYAFLAKTLPAYAIPSHFIWMKSFPLMPSGKVDVKALPDPQEEVSQDDSQLAMTALEKEVLAIVQELLRRNVHINNRFFEVGGNSMKATQLFYRIEEQYNVRLRLRDIFDHNEIREIAELIRKSSDAVETPIPLAPKADHYALSYAQMSLWIMNQFSGVKSAFNLMDLYQLTGNLDTEILRKAFQMMVSRHEITRTVYRMVNGSPRQIVLPYDEDMVAFEVLDYRGKHTADADQVIEHHARHQFDLEEGPLLKLTLIQQTSDQYIFVLIFHHIITDGVSLQLFLTELIAHYEGLVSGKGVALPPMRIHYKDYAQWYRSQADTKAFQNAKQFWNERYKVLPHDLDLKVDFPRPQAKTFKGGTLVYEFNEPERDMLMQKCQQQEVIPSIFMLSGVYAFIAELTGATDVVIGTSVTGRFHKDLAHQQGTFINTLPIRATFENITAFDALLATVRTEMLNGMEHQIYPFDLLVDDLKSGRSGNRNPLFDIRMVYLDLEQVEFNKQTIDGLEIKEIPYESDDSKYDLMFYFVKYQQQMIFKLEYNADIYQRATVEGFRDDFVRIVRVAMKENYQLDLSQHANAAEISEEEDLFTRQY